MKNLLVIMVFVSVTGAFAQEQGSGVTGLSQNGAIGAGVTGLSQSGAVGAGVTGLPQSGGQFTDCKMDGKDKISCPDGEYVKVPSTDDSIRTLIEKEISPPSKKIQNRSKASAQ